MHAEQVVYLKNNHPAPEKGAEKDEGTLRWQYDSRLYEIKPGQTLSIPYHLANHALSAGPDHRKFLEILDEKLGQEAALKSIAEIAAQKAADSKAAASAAIEKAKQDEAEAKRLIAAANANKKDDEKKDEKK